MDSVVTSSSEILGSRVPSSLTSHFVAFINEQLHTKFIKAHPCLMYSGLLCIQKAKYLFRQYIGCLIYVLKIPVRQTWKHNKDTLGEKQEENVYLF